jgi:hypothetical protein
MEIATSLLFLVLVIIPVILFITQPLTRRWRKVQEGNQTLSTLLAERDHVLNAIRELDFDNSLGKIPVEEYPGQRDTLVRHGAEILKQIDKITPQQGSNPISSTAKGDAVEAFLSARRNQTGGKINISRGDRADSLIEQRRKVVMARANQHCPHCGKPVLGSDLFCPSCGKSLR